MRDVARQSPPVDSATLHYLPYMLYWECPSLIAERMKKKKRHPLVEEGYKLVPETSGKIVDSIWERDDGIIIIFAWGNILRYGLIEDKK